jgi:predicted metal-dependent peptidase
MDAMRAKVAQFRTAVKKILPYFTGEVYGMIAIEEKRVGTMAVDEQGRMYYAPEFVRRCSIEQGRFTVCHETLHVALGHARLARKILGDNPTQSMLKAWNYAADCVVNQILGAYLHEAPGEDVLGPGATIVTHQTLGLPPRLTITQYYDLLMQQQQEQPQNPGQRGTGKDDDTEDDEDEDMEGAGEGEPDDRDGEPDEQGGGDGGEQDVPHDPSEGDGEGGEEDEGDDDGEGEGGARPGEGGAERDGGADRPSQDGVEDSSDAEGEGCDGDPADDGGDGSWSPTGGSGADGVPRGYEAERDPSWADREYSLAKQLEAAIEEAERSSPGSVPGELKAAVGLRLRPQPDPYDALRASVARAVASPVGAPDFTLKRFSRRQQPGMPRLRGVNKLTPNVVVLLDTSGSMGFRCPGYERAERALDVIAKGIRKLKSVRVICWDTQKHSARMVQSMQGFEVQGGGGTDMGQAIETIDKELRPDAILMVTDLETGWCERKPRARVVIAATEAPSEYYPVPGWATVVDLTRGGGQ